MPVPFGKIDLCDKSNILFSFNGVVGPKSDEHRVVQAISNHQNERLKFITARAILGRAYAFGFFDWTCHESSLSVLFRGDNPRWWSKLEYIANCICLRGCFGALIKRKEADGYLESFLQDIKTGFALFLYVVEEGYIDREVLNGYMGKDSAAADDKDSVLKYHAAVRSPHKTLLPATPDTNISRIAGNRKLSF